jgi:hypothetical protein|tara:strand:+ start:1116 stop:2042 length:927 start_codon:yes stop_codon:yes gene_type:complete
MIYLSAQPDSLYFAWQVEVMLENFIEKGIDQNKIHIVVGYKGSFVSQNFIKLKAKYNRVNFGFIKDIRPKTNYISSIRPFILMKYFQKNWQLKFKTIFYHDCDILFTRKPELSIFKKDEIWYQSNTNDYLNYKYVKSKGDDVLQKMLDIAETEENVFKKNMINCGGAQTIMKNVDWVFWQKVYILSEKLFTQLTDLNNQKVKENPKYHTLQIWCADMWALLFTAWKLGHETKTDKILDFTWATCHTNKWHKNLIYHNAGVTRQDKKLFMKQNFTNKLPYFVNIDIDRTKSNSKYYDLVKTMGKKTCLK